MRPTLRAIWLLHLPCTLALVGCADSGTFSHPHPQNRELHAALTAQRQAEASETSEATGPAMTDPVADLEKRVQAFARSVSPAADTQPEAAAAPETAPLPVDLPPTPAGAGPEVTSSIPPLETGPLARVESAPVPETPPVEATDPPASVEQVPEPVATDEGAAHSLRSRLEQRLAAEPGALASIFDYQLLRLIDDSSASAGGSQDSGGSPQLAAKVSPGAIDLAAMDLTAEDEAILRTVAEGLSGFRENLVSISPQNRPLPSEKIAPLDQMMRRLHRQVGLELPVMALCQEVSTFGAYTPLPDQFPLGTPQDVVLYVEVDRFASERQENGMWETRLTMEAVLYDPEGAPILEMPSAQGVDRSHQRRRDFFVWQVLTLPAISEPGRYTLKVTVQDKLSNRIAQQSLPLTFGPSTGN